MTLFALTIPDDPADLPGWLEDRLMAPDFAAFAAELRAVFPGAPASDVPRHLLDRWLPVALTDGLDPLPPDVLSQLLQYPAVLAAFQERIATDGGEYWDDVLARSTGLDQAFSEGKQALAGILAADVSSIVKVSRPVVPSEAAKRSTGRGTKIWAATATGIAACLALAVGYLSFREPDEPPIQKSQIAWGWGKPSGLATDQTNPRDYLTKLAANAEEWHQYRPTDVVGVGTRVAELRIGCTRLMHSAYGPLAAADKAWLLDHCRSWAKALDAHQQSLDAGADPQQVRAAVDETIQSIVNTLREKAAGLG
ncbi:hypothetical protein [Limnoglobus roseus]|uniref:Uncharacterized protein n=1 Tax=Limnoglobus roseus TaxID=2598579 RepID=A0A5C1ARN1_9BACT|nr:hypothetical protein [Limnoglobus roseus]QEL20817.1 hypothetical protein PX52LOC_07937 [Limnoglobus roseus]